MPRVEPPLDDEPEHPSIASDGEHAPGEGADTAIPASQERRREGGVGEQRGGGRYGPGGDRVRMATPVIPRVRVDIGKRVRSPDFFRTQYLSNLGIWAGNRANQLTSAPQTEARYRANDG